MLRSKTAANCQNMDYAITFALLLYINVFYFGLYACVEFCLLVFKCYQVLRKFAQF